MKTQQTPRNWKPFFGEVSNDVAIAQNEIYHFTLSDHYTLYDFGNLINLSANSDAVIILNGSQQIPALKREVTPITQKFQTVAVKNIGSSTIAINELKLNYVFQSKKPNFVERGFQLLPFIK